MNRTLLISAAAAALLAIAPASAQNTKVDVGGGKGLVVVDLSLLDQAQIDVLRDANIEVLNDNTVQVPITVAATLCNTQVNLIASGNTQGTKTCQATADGVANLGS